MALVTDLLAHIEDLGFIEVTYDDALAVGDNTSNTDLISVRVVIEAGRTVKYSVRRGQSRNWHSGSATGPIDEAFSAGGSVKKYSDLTGFGFGGDE